MEVRKDGLLHNKKAIEKEAAVAVKNKGNAQVLVFLPVYFVQSLKW